MIYVTGSMNAPDVLDWPVTARMDDATSYGVDGAIRMKHSKTGLWPQVPIADDGTLSEGNLWGVAMAPDGRWYARTLHHIRPGQTEKNFPLADWSVDREALAFPAGFAPKAGDKIGLFCSTRARYGRAPVNERTDIVWILVGQPGILSREWTTDEPPPIDPDEPLPDPPDGGPIKIEVDWDEEFWVAQIATIRDEIKAQGRELQQQLDDVRRIIEAELQKGLKIRFR